MASSIPGSATTSEMGGPEMAPHAPHVRRAPAKPWRSSSSLSARLGVVILVAALAVAVGAPAVAPHDPLKQNLGNALARPAAAHWLGTDNVGRDVLSRVVWGTRVSLVAGFVSVGVGPVARNKPGLGARHCRRGRRPGPSC